MLEFFATIYEWFGLIPFYSTDMGDHLRGYDVTCTDFIATPWYVYIGWIMIVLISLVFVLMYYIVGNKISDYNEAKHWWYFALGLVLLNFFIAFGIPYNSLQAGEYCNQLNINSSDCIGFGFSSALWSLIFFGIISSIPLFRSRSNNCRHTTFWKP
jgi:hypothetical protein